MDETSFYVRDCPADAAPNPDPVGMLLNSVLSGAYPAQANRTLDRRPIAMTDMTTMTAITTPEHHAGRTGL